MPHHPNLNKTNAIMVSIIIISIIVIIIFSIIIIMIGRRTVGADDGAHVGGLALDLPLLGQAELLAGNGSVEVERGEGGSQEECEKER